MRGCWRAQVSSISDVTLMDPHLTNVDEEGKREGEEKEMKRRRWGRSEENKVKGRRRRRESIHNRSIVLSISRKFS